VGVGLGVGVGVGAGVGVGRAENFYMEQRAAPTDLGNHGGANDEAALNELVGFVTEDLTVLARARLRLVGVNHQVAGTAVRLVLGHERVLEARRET
jgi:hypothetical protein